jgi:hypothetical protein
MTALGKTAQGLRTFASDIAQGFFEITHNSFALVGLAVVFSLITLTARPDLRQVGESKLMSWLQQRQAATLGMEPELDAIDRATAANPKDLPKQQAAVAYWLSKKYRVAPEPVSALVAEAYEIGDKAKLDPTLILAVMAVESGFNPFAQSSVGAQGQAGRLRPGHQPAGRRQGAAGMHPARRLAQRRPEVLRRRRQPGRRRRLCRQGDGRTCPTAPGGKWPRRAAGTAADHPHDRHPGGAKGSRRHDRSPLIVLIAGAQLN